MSRRLGCPTSEAEDPLIRHRIPILILLTLVGLALRLHQLGDIPFGFHTDEGHNALDAWRIASEGWRPAFLERNNGREPLFMYLMAACMAAFGPTIWSARLAGVIAGVLLIPAQFLLVQALPIPRARRVALLSAAFLALTFWPVAQARYALRAALLPLWVTLMAWAWWRAMEGGLGKADRVGESGRVPGDQKVAPTGVSGYEDAGGARGTDRVSGDQKVAPTAGSGGLGKVGVLRGGIGPWVGGTGVFIALAAWTHLTGRFLPLALAVSAAWVALRARRPGPLIQFALACLIALALLLPQIRFFLEAPDMLSYRSDQVSILNPEVNEGDLAGTLGSNALRLAQMPVLRGDSSWYHNIKRRPIWSDLLSPIAFLIGLAVFLSHLLGRYGPRVQSAAILLSATGLLALAPSLLSMGAPNYVRLTGIWPTLFLLPALGLDRAMAWLESQDLPPSGGRPYAYLLAGFLPGFLLASTYRDYFQDYATEPEVYTAFNAAAVERGQAIAEIAREGSTYATPALWNQSVIRFLNLSHPLPIFDPRSGLVLPPEFRRDPETFFSDGAQYLFDPVEADAAADFDLRWRAARREISSRYAGSNLIALRLPTESRWTTRSWLHIEMLEGNQRAPFGQQILALGTGFIPSDYETHASLLDGIDPGESITFLLIWETLAPTSIDHNFFLRLVSATGEEIAAFDGPPLAGSHPTNLWQPGSTILQPTTLQISPTAPSGPATLLHGWYDWRTGNRLPIPGDDDGAAEIATVEID